MNETLDPRDFARKIRINAVQMVNAGNSSHIGSALGVADIVAVLFNNILNINSREPRDENRDRFILSKGHSGAIVYAAMSERGFLAKEKLLTHYQNGSTLSGHISHIGNPGIELSTGSLGHGLSVCVGISLALLKKNNRSRVFCLLSDGECDEGSVWEAALFAAHHKLTNLVAIIDYNKLQSLNTNEKTLNLEPFEDKWKSFGWEVINLDGHNYKDLIEALTSNPNLSKPLVVIANTTKGKGVSFMENSVLWHYRTPKNEEFEAAIAELENSQ